MPDRKRKQPSWLRFSGVGFEFVGAIGGLAAIGYWIDASYGSKPWGLVIGAALGTIGGMYNLIRRTIGAFDPPTKPGGPEDRDHGK